MYRFQARKKRDIFARNLNFEDFKSHWVSCLVSMIYKWSISLYHIQFYAKKTFQLYWKCKGVDKVSWGTWIEIEIRTEEKFYACQQCLKMKWSNNILTKSKIRASVCKVMWLILHEFVFYILLKAMKWKVAQNWA